MTASATPAVQRPVQVLWASVAVVVSGVFSAISSLLTLTPGAKQWLFDQTKSSDLKSSDIKSGKKAMPTDAEIHHTANSVATQSAIIGVVMLVVLGYVAYSLYRGKYWTRWGVIGLLVLLTFAGGSGGIGGLLLIRSDAPAAFKITAFIGSLGILAAAVLVNMRPTLSYLVLTKPERRTRAGGGGLFAPRTPPASSSSSSSGSAASGSAKADSSPTRKPATVRPATPAAKPATRKARVDVTAPARPRGKSRRADVDKTS